MRFYRIYQLPHNNNNLFRPLRTERAIDIGDYCCVWADTLPETIDCDEAFCEELFRKFNIDHPKGFGGHSMSISDIVAIHEDDNVRYYYCDSFGFKKISLQN